MATIPLIVRATTTGIGIELGQPANTDESNGPATALNEGFQAGLLVAAGILVVAVVLSAAVSRCSRPAPVAERVDAEPEPARA